ncbi:uncharacterized protein [Oryza sativa Japonica Group]|uniref:Os11g0586400 protein n=3 Tax=Oryza TaxID=4527 RepID=Q2R1Z3_ORYSJ|nr:uncharacterized protein LOC112936890 [Oryza sativa Japonica Group]ABA94452.1 hypothetical protein LOC_Os11g37570 [Oryza sativa Japonica Group]ARB16033.1 XA10-Ni [Oryza sativa Japonica Group]EAZ18865.1 hypothetical protein OsJ_34404 [Oryza sativa Japonica Group]BAT14639.1 Os11g0586400 [Oryza sativa Japonica Group]
MELITACALLLIAVHIAIVISCPEPLAAVALVDVPLLYLCRYLLIIRRGVIIVSGAGAGGGRLRRFRLGAAMAIIYMAMSTLFFLRIAPLTPWWGALAAWVMILLIVEAIFAFFFPYRCCFNETEGDVQNNPHV